MGRFFSSVQIKSNGSREQFLKAFCDLMIKRGLATCSEDEASVSYILAFSESGKWVTLTCEAYRDDTNRVKTDARQTAAEMKTSSFGMEVVDSDFALLQLYKDSSAADTVIVGDGSGYGFDGDNYQKGKRECWEQLLASGKSWEQLSEIWNKNEVFVEDALYEAASVLGIESKYMVSDYDDLNGIADKDTNVVPLFFKKKITVSEGGKKKLTLNAAFKQVFGEALEPLGFKKVKGRQPYFVRLIGDEIIHVITYRNESERVQGYKAFNILGGVATVYRQEINLTISPMDNLGWLNTISDFYTIPNSQFDMIFRRVINKFQYKADSETLIDVLSYAADLTKKIILPIFDKVNDINNCINYFNQFKLPMHLFDEKEEFGERYADFYDEGFLYIKTNDINGIKKKIEERKELILYNIERGTFGYTDVDLKKTDEMDAKPYIDKVLAILEQRKTKNIQKIITYGMEV